MGIGALPILRLQNRAAWFVVAGVILHGWGMFNKRRLEKQNGVPPAAWSNANIPGVLAPSGCTRDLHAFTPAMMMRPNRGIKMKKTGTNTFVLLLALCAAGSVFGHDTWLIPDRFQVDPKATVKLDLTSGMAFPKLETGPKRERIQSGQCRIADRTFEISDISAAPQSLVFKVALPEAGVATLWVKLPSREIELKPAEVQEYLDEISAPEAVRDQWSKMQPQRWRERYTKHPKTFVRVGDAGTDRSWSEPVGMELEIVPEKDPTTLRVGDELPVRVLKAGAPHRDFALNAVAAGETKGETKRTDNEGRVVFRFDKAGQWLLRGTDLRKAETPGVDWESDFATLTLAVKEK